MSSLNRPLCIAVDARLVQTDAGGDSTYWTRLIQELGQIPDLNLVAFSDRPKPPGVLVEKWHTITAPNSRWWSYVTFPIAARRAGADLIHTQYALSPLVGKRGVTTVHDVSFAIQPEWFASKDRFLLNRFVPAAIRRAVAVLTVSKTSQHEIEKHFPAAMGKCFGILNGESTFKKLEREKARAILGDRVPSEPFALTVSSIWARKNTAFAIEVCREIDQPLVLVGKNKGLDLPRYSRSFPLGYVSDEELQACYSLAHVYLCPSLHEGFGLPVVEAMQCGVPVFSSNCGALPEVVGAAGRLLDPTSKEQWVVTLKECWNNPSILATMVAKGEARSREFSWRKCAQEVAEVYRWAAQQ